MKVRDLGYREWQGELRPESERWWATAETGFRLAWRSMWLRRMLMIAWLPAIMWGLAFFAIENAVSRGVPEEAVLRVPLFQSLPDYSTMRDNIRGQDLASSRHEIWAWLLAAFFRYPQGTLLVMVVGLVAPPLIAQDIRSRAYMIYFSRPITILEYVLGKAAVVGAYVAMITTVPALFLYVLGVLLSPDLSVLYYTWDLPLRIIASSVVLMIPTISLALCYSSLTQETRYAAFAWYATWILGWVAYFQLTVRDVMVNGMESAEVVGGRWSLLSLYHSLGRVQAWIFGLETQPDVAASAGLLLAIITVVSFGVLMRRVQAPLKT
jgi:ABC-2 type transport system permease protein